MRSKRPLKKFSNKNSQSKKPGTVPVFFVHTAWNTKFDLFFDRLCNMNISLLAYGINKIIVIK